MNKVNFTRRKFLKHSGIATAALMGNAHLSALASSNIQNTNAQGGGDYKALVCVLLAGGADSFNMLVPTDNTYYAQYQKTRTDLALPQNTLLALNDANNNGRTLGLHPQMTGIQSLFNEGKLAFLSNVGTLVEPTTTASLANYSAKLPLGLYSHNDQISQWQTALPDARSGTGWGGRMADLMSTQNANQRISMSVSTAGANDFQAGRLTDYFSVIPGDNPTPVLTAKQDYDADVGQAIDQIYGNSGFNNVFRRAYGKVFNEAISANDEFAAAVKSAQSISTQFANDEFSQQMKSVAKTIAANQSLGMKRQTFFVTYGGWDHHDETIANMERMVKVLNDGLLAFQTAVQELGMEQNVTTFTASDFGRTLSSNGRGSDHAWGGNAMIMGGAVKGGKVYGEYPSLELGNPLDTGRGVLMPTTSLDLYFAELALWFGIPNTILPDILPNVGRFYDVNSKQAPLGFMV